ATSSMSRMHVLPSACAALACPALFDGQRRTDEADVGEGLRKIAERTSGCGVDLLGKKTEVVLISEEAFKKTLCVFECASAERQAFDRPKATSGKCALYGWVGTAKAIE